MRHRPFSISTGPSNSLVFHFRLLNILRTTQQVKRASFLAVYVSRRQESYVLPMLGGDLASKGIVYIVDSLVEEVDYSPKFWSRAR